MIENPTSDNSGRFAYRGLDRVMHEKARLGILTSLVVHPDGLLFGELKELCELTDGNLSRHLQSLSEAGLVEIWKKGEGRKAQTLVCVTKEGQRQFLDYISVLEGVVADAAEARSATVRRQSPARQGWSPA
ncbi:MAG: ArsR family transcriptional regulator [Planctomycetota bacterium]|nr:MAG: ArsR family transcriptional regulator [Planctomycetota bacterium]REJ94506.1 MAG: ArsR family transcriptional regulator [Planctomycetota bacterium]REK21289.1 MAG: ArsR family transcriptional regulator [Planctomycetota bacterium]REK32082.1 MAG: ArsR family transcriptional regulator [Planctomycetota bacterium]